MILTAVTALAIGNLQRLPAGVEKIDFNVAGFTRESFIYFPQTKDATPRPVIFIFHGHGGNGLYSLRKYKANEQWPQAISVHMTGMPTKGITDPEGTKNGWQRNQGDYEDRDLKFFDKVFEYIHTKQKVNDKQVFVTGHSNGGMFTYLLWKARPNVFRAISPSAALGGFKPGLESMPAFVVSGTQDQIVSFKAQQRSVTAIRRLNDCEAKSETPYPGATLWNSSKNAPVMHYVYEGDHTMPDNIPKLTFDFFKQFTKN